MLYLVDRLRKRLASQYSWPLLAKVSNQYTTVTELTPTMISGDEKFILTMMVTQAYPSSKQCKTCPMDCGEQSSR